MTSTIKKHGLLAALVLAALLTIGTATAAAHGGGPGRGGKGGAGGVSVSTLVTRAATQLDVTRANLVAAIRASANARINGAVEDEDIDADEAAELKENVEDNLRFAYGLSRASTVASNLKMTTTALNNGFRAARRAILTTQIDQAAEDEEITAEEAAELKAELADAELPGYKPSAFSRGFGFGGGQGGFGFGFRR